MIITAYEMDRRKAVAAARSRMTNAMIDCPELTPLEWLEVLTTMQQRIVAVGLSEEWKDDQ